MMQMRLLNSESDERAAMRFALGSILCALAIAIVVGCSRNDGIGVGNGFKSTSSSEYLVYKSPAKFQVRYHSDLVLEVDPAHPDKEVTIDNRRQAEEATKRSQVRFSVSYYKKDYLAYSPSSLLRDHVNAMRVTLPLGDWHHVDFPGAQGWFVERKEATSLKATYYLLTSNFDRVVVHIDAQEMGRGMELVAPIIHTFTFDAKPPMIHSLVVENQPLIAGQPAVLKVHATDDFSGVGDFKSGCDSFHLEAASPSESNLTVCGRVSSLGDDRYGIPIQVNKFRPTGDYVLESFVLSDKADNYIYLRVVRDARGNREPYYRRESYNDAGLRVSLPTTIPVLIVSVKNNGVSDRTPPKVHEFLLGALEAGQKGVLQFRATDDNSGITNFKGDCSELKPSKRLGQGGAGINICGFVTPVPGKPNWYQIELNVNRFRPTDEYVLVEFTLSDKAGNYVSLSGLQIGGLRPRYLENRTLETSVNVLRTTVTNRGVEDVTPPTILEFAPLDQPIFSNRKSMLRFRAVDQPAGINKFKGNCDEFVYQGSAAGPETQRVNLCGPVADLGGGWYGIEFEIKEFRPPGQYALTKFSISDEAGNTTYLDSVRNGNQIVENHFYLATTPGARVPTTIQIPKFTHVK
jgi:hypothetical protein